MNKLSLFITSVIIAVLLPAQSLGADWGHLKVQADPTGLSLQEVYLVATPGDWQLTAGFQQLQWGPGRTGDLFLSDQASLWAVTAQKTWLLWGYQIKTQQLVASVDPGLNKMLFAHRLESEVWPGVVIGLAESAIATGEFTPWLYNPIPIWPYYLTQHLVKKADSIQDRLINVNLALDATITRSSGTQIYGQLFIDDAQQDLARRNTVPDWGGFLVGVSAPNLAWWPGWSGLAEYILITNWTYTHKNVDNSYILPDGTSLGHWLGPDADAIVVRFEHQISDETSVRLRLQLERHGKGVLGEGWRPEYGKENLFLSGVVEKRYLVGAGVKSKITNNLCLESELFWIGKINADNIPDKSSNEVRLEAKATWQI